MTLPRRPRRASARRRGEVEGIAALVAACDESYRAWAPTGWEPPPPGRGAGPLARADHRRLVVDARRGRAGRAGGRARLLHPGGRAAHAPRAAGRLPVRQRRRTASSPSSRSPAGRTSRPSSPTPTAGARASPPGCWPLAEDAMRAEGYREVQLWTPREAPARRFYEASGLAARRARAVAGRAGAADRRVRQAAVSLRIYLGAFGDPGHAFPMLALGEALVAPRPRRRAADVAALGGARDRGGDDVRRRAGVPGLPHPRAAAAAVPGGGPRRARDRAVRAGVRARHRGLGHPHRRRPRSPPSCATCRSRRSFRTSTRGRRPASRPTRSAPGCRGPAPARGSGARFDPLVGSAASSGGGGEYNDCRARLGPVRRCPASTPGSRARSRSWARCRSSSTRAAGSPGCGSSGRCCGSRRASGSRRRRATARSCWSRRRPRRTPSTGCCAPRSRGWRARRCA